MATIDVINPATAEKIASVPNMTADEVDEVVQQAKQALPEWLDATPGERAALLLKLADVIESNAEELAQIDSLNTGMPFPQANRNMDAAIEYFRYFAGWCTKIHGAARDIRMHGGLNG